MIDLHDFLEDMFPDEVVVRRFTGHDDFGAATYQNDEETLMARIVGRNQVVLDTDGNESVSNVHAVFNGVHGLSHNDQFTLPAHFTTDRENPDNIAARQPRAMSVEIVPDENGPHHEVVYFANARVRL